MLGFFVPDCCAIAVVVTNKAAPSPTRSSVANVLLAFMMASTLLIPVPRLNRIQKLAIDAAFDDSYARRFHRLTSPLFAARMQQGKSSRTARFSDQYI